MIGLGTIINIAAIIIGGLIGLLCGSEPVNLIWEKKLRVANMLPAVIVAVVCAFIRI